MSGLSPDMIIHPGETLKEVLEDRKMTSLDLSLRTDVSADYISSVLCGNENISTSFAKKLEHTLGIEAEFWINLQTAYDREKREICSVRV